MGPVRVGTSGFSYDDWRGYFYPEDIDKGEMLRYYVRHFTAVEVNSSFYAVPSRAAFASMSAKTPDDFEFVVKAPKNLTHEADLDRAVGNRFISALQPLMEAGKLGCILAQYPWGFKHNDSNVRKIRELGEYFAGIPVVVEFRNADWVVDETFDLLRESNLGFCCVDEPRLKGLMPSVVEATSPIGYVRFHGRNASKWWHHDEAWQRYDYLYSREELDEWSPRVRELQSKTVKLYLFFNNHYKGQAAENAQMFAQILGIDTHKEPSALG